MKLMNRLSELRLYHLGILSTLKFRLIMKIRKSTEGLRSSSMNWLRMQLHQLITWYMHKKYFR